MVVGYNTSTRHFTDEDSNSLFEHVAIVAQSSLGGTWQYNLNGGAGWVNFPTVSGSNALLLEATHSLRYVRASGSESGDATVTFRAWDKSDSASTGRTKDLTNLIPLTVNGDNTSPYSSETEVATVSIDSSNDAPVLLTSGTSILNGSGNSFTHKTNFSTISEDNTNNTGKSVSTFFEPRLCKR